MYELNKKDFEKAVLNKWPEPSKDTIYIEDEINIGVATGMLKRLDIDE